MTNRIPVLAPPRAERIRLETLLADVWTREILPYPGMTSRARSEHLVRTSASSMIRKLSVASIASNFTKRSGSVASFQMTFEDDESGGHDVHRSTPSRAECHSDPISTLDLDDSTRSRLSIIQDEKENVARSESLDFLPSGSPANTLKRFATQKVRSWSHDGHRIITPPLRTSSANSVLMRGAPLTPVSTTTDLVIEGKAKDKENMPRVGAKTEVGAGGGKQAKKEKEKSRLGIVGGRTGVAEGIRNFFR